jgi:hypothetical protein
MGTTPITPCGTCHYCIAGIPESCSHENVFQPAVSAPVEPRSGVSGISQTLWNERNSLSECEWRLKCEAYLRSASVSLRVAPAAAPSGEPPRSLGTYACPYCGITVPHAHESRLGFALPKLLQEIHHYKRMFRHLAALYQHDSDLQHFFDPHGNLRGVEAAIADVKAAFKSTLHEELVPLEGMKYDEQRD